MTVPLWLAIPPEVHSALLSSGPGAGPLLAAAQSWETLSIEYGLLATELGEVLDRVRAGLWQGPAAESYVLAHLPYLAWLNAAGAAAARGASRHAAVGAAYTAALAAMPTLAQLAANRTAHAALTATNFFGINTIPLVLNEADYGRMWLQAAATMTAYQAAGDAALAEVPAAVPAPRIVGRSDFTLDADDDNDPLGIKQALRNLTDLYHLLFDGPFDEIAQILASTLPGVAAAAAGAGHDAVGVAAVAVPGSAATPAATARVPASAAVAGNWPQTPTPAPVPAVGGATSSVPGPAAAAAPVVAVALTVAPPRQRMTRAVAGAGPDAPPGPSLTDGETAPAAASRVATSNREAARRRRRRPAKAQQAPVAAMAGALASETGGPGSAAQPPGAAVRSGGRRADTAARATGLTTVDDGRFDSALTVPMLPATWTQPGEAAGG
ncbi:PPE domain-containing protein [Mycolicibacter minnesotensis]